MKHPALPEGLLVTKEGWYVLEQDTHLSRYVENAQNLCVENLNKFAPYIPNGGTVIDAGACIGDHTLWYAQQAGKDGHVHAFEPHPLSYQCLLRNMHAFPQVECYNAGLGAKPFTGRLYKHGNVGASYLMPSDQVAPLKDTAVVKIISLDDTLLPVLTGCDFIHLDVEGHEPAVLGGAVEILRKFHPAMLLEVSKEHLPRAGFSEEDLYALLAREGYRYFEVDNKPTDVQRDILCFYMP